MILRTRVAERSDHPYLGTLVFPNRADQIAAYPEAPAIRSDENQKIVLGAKKAEHGKFARGKTQQLVPVGRNVRQRYVEPHHPPSNRYPEPGQAPQLTTKLIL